VRTDTDARGPTNPTTRVRWANASTARKTRQRLSPSGRIPKCPALRPPSARRVGMGLTCCWCRKISGRRISNLKFQMVKAKEAKHRKKERLENTHLSPTPRKWSTRKIQGKFGIQLVGHPPAIRAVVMGLVLITTYRRFDNRVRRELRVSNRQLEGCPSRRSTPKSLLLKMNRSQL